MELSELKQTRQQIRERVHTKLVELTTPRLRFSEIAEELGIDRRTLYNFKNNYEYSISDETVDKLSRLLEEKEKEEKNNGNK